MKRMIGLCCLLVVTCSFIIGCDKPADAPASGDKAAAPAAGDKPAAPAADEHK